MLPAGIDTDANHCVVCFSTIIAYLLTWAYASLKSSKLVTQSQ